MMFGDQAMLENIMKYRTSGEFGGDEGMGDEEAAARTVNFDPNSTGSENYRATAYDRNYYDPNSGENRFVGQQLNELANHYGNYGRQVQGEVGRVMPGAGNTSLGNFANTMRAREPMQAADMAVRGNQYEKRWTGDQTQKAGQRDWTIQARELAMKKALAEQGAAVDIFNSREKGKREEAEANSKASSGAMGAIGGIVGGAFGGPVGYAIGSKLGKSL